MRSTSRGDLRRGHVRRPSEEPRAQGGGGAGTGLEHFALRIGPGGHPALRNKLVRQGARLRHRPRRDRAAALRRRSTRAARPLDSILLLTRARATRRTGGSYRYRPVAGRRLLEQAGCRRGADGIYACEGSGSRFADHCRRFRPGARLRARPGAAQAGRYRGRPRTSPGRCSSAGILRAATST